MQPSILIADDHPLVLKGLQDFLTEKNYNIVAAETDGKQAFNSIIKHNPDIAILDIRMPFMTGLEIASACKKTDLKTKIILITFEKDESLYFKAKSLNVNGYVLKEFALVEIENCIKAVNENNTYFSEQLVEHLSANSEPEIIGILTPTEKKVLHYIVKNKTAKEIGEILFISSRTVEKHKSHIIRKANLEAKHNSLVLFAKELEAFLSDNK
jgi:DNA-binding NarL/FixJ family response regulator